MAMERVNLLVALDNSKASQVLEVEFDAWGPGTGAVLAAYIQIPERGGPGEDYKGTPST